MEPKMPRIPTGSGTNVGSLGIKARQGRSESVLKVEAMLTRCGSNAALNVDLETTDEASTKAPIPTAGHSCGRDAGALANSRRGRTKGGPEEEFSPEPVAKGMGELMKQDFVCDLDGEATYKAKGMGPPMSVPSNASAATRPSDKGARGLRYSSPRLALTTQHEGYATAHRGWPSRRIDALSRTLGRTRSKS